jgi:hypothetical protein
MQVRYDNITIQAQLTPEGWIVDKPVITRAGIFTYRDAKGRTVREYRPDDEVFKEDSLKTLLGAPITDGHKGMLNSEGNLDGVVIGSVLTQGERSDQNVVAGIVIHNVKKSAQGAIFPLVTDAASTKFPVSTTGRNMMSSNAT